MAPKIEVLIGPIASGKSTYARERAAAGAILVCHDTLTESFHGAYRYEQELREFYRECESTIAAAALLKGRDLVIDRTHLTAESRARWVRIGSIFRAPCHAVVFPNLGPFHHARLRFQADSRGRSAEEWLRVAMHHQEQFEREPPVDLEREGFAFVVTVPAWAPGGGVAG